MLRSLGARYGFRAEKIDPVRYKDFVVSSTRIRRLLGEGRVDEAGALLGHHYFIDGTVTRGAGRGRELGFPTANLATCNELVPPSGVYATTVTIDNIVYPSITNIGMLSDVSVVSVSIAPGGSTATIKLSGKTADGTTISGTAFVVREDGGWKLGAPEDWQEQNRQ